MESKLELLSPAGDILGFSPEPERTEVIGLEEGMPGGARVLKSASSEATNITANVSPYGQICITFLSEKHLPEPCFLSILSLPDTHDRRTTEVIFQLQL